jgi:hypothetical protein
MIFYPLQAIIGGFSRSPHLLFSRLLGANNRRKTPKKFIFNRALVPEAKKVGSFPSQKGNAVTACTKQQGLAKIMRM